MSTGKLCCEDERRKRKETKKVINHFPLHFLCVNCKLLSLVYLFHVPSNGSLDWKRSIFCFSYTFSYVDPIVTQSFLSLWIWAPILPEENCSRVVVGGWMLKVSKRRRRREALFNNNNIHPTRIDITRENECRKATLLKLEREEIHFLLLHFSGFIYIFVIMTLTLLCGGRNKFF